jgi:hypothetical protein
MKRVLVWLESLVVAFSLGTFVTLVVLLAVLWWKGALADERLIGMLAALQGIQPAPPAAPDNTLSADAEQPSLEQILQARVRASLDFDLRESAIDKALGDLRAIEEQIKTESGRLDHWKKDFDFRLAKLETAATDAALLELQRTLEAVQPKQAKDQIMKILEEHSALDDQPLHDVVTIVKAMPLDKRRKILGEFKSEPEIEKLAEIIREIRLGTPDTELIRGTRTQLQQQLNPQR